MGDEITHRIAVVASDYAGSSLPLCCGGAASSVHSFLGLERVGTMCRADAAGVDIALV
jgi:hypothetical protein